MFYHVVGEVVSNRTHTPGLDLENNIGAVRHPGLCVDLGTQADVVVELHEAVVIVVDYRLALRHLTFHQLPVERFLVEGQVALHDLPETHQDVVLNLE